MTRWTRKNKVDKDDEVYKDNKVDKDDELDKDDKMDKDDEDSKEEEEDMDKKEEEEEFFLATFLKCQNLQACQIWCGLRNGNKLVTTYILHTTTTSDTKGEDEPSSPLQ